MLHHLNQTYGAIRFAIGALRLTALGTIAVAVFWSHRLEKVDNSIGQALGKKNTTEWLAKKFEP